MEMTLIDLDDKICNFKGSHAVTNLHQERPVFPSKIKKNSNHLIYST